MKLQQSVPCSTYPTKQLEPTEEQVKQEVKRVCKRLGLGDDWIVGINFKDLSDDGAFARVMPNMAHEEVLLEMDRDAIANDGLRSWQYTVAHEMAHIPLAHMRKRMALILEGRADEDRMFDLFDDAEEHTVHMIAKAIMAQPEQEGNLDE